MPGVSGDEEPRPKEKPTSIQVPAEVLKGLEAVRQSGLTNMLDRPRVAFLAEEMGFSEAATWIRAHRIVVLTENDAFSVRVNG